MRFNEIYIHIYIHIIIYRRVREQTFVSSIIRR